MSITNPMKPLAQRTQARTIGPEILFASAVILAFAVLAWATMALSRDWALPAVSTLLLVLAGAAALVAWLSERTADAGRVTYWDVAGALTLIGIGAAALVDPEQLARIVEAPHRDK
jgi:hypothetical protein